MTDQQETARKVRLQLKNEFGFYSRHCLKIRNKDAEIVPLNLNTAQTILDQAVNKQIAETGKVRIIILKARQQGLSTYVEARGYFKVSQAKAQKALVVAHKAKSTKALFGMTKRFHDNVPDFVKPATKYNSGTELTFDKLDSSFMVETAGGDGIGRGETINFAHVSELAFWPETNARENLNGLLESIPNSAGSEVYIESTANGVTGPFYEIWQGAIKGENGFVPVFIPWFLDRAYADPEVPYGFQRTPDETSIAERALQEWDVKLSDAQFWWRRQKVAQKGLDLFAQEYPAYPDEAFLTTGRPVFDVKQLQEWLREDTVPKRRLAHLIDEFSEHHSGELSLFAEIDPGESYTIGADVAMGVRGGDYSVAQVLDSQKNQVAIWRGHIHPDYFAAVLRDLGYLFNTAKIAVESNNHGLLTVTKLYKDYNYPDVYTDVLEDKVSDVDTPMLGFRTTSKTRPLIIDDLRAALRLGKLRVRDQVTLKEMLTFVVKENGKPEAEQGCHDDCVMSLAIANHVHEGVYSVITMNDDWYIDAI